MIVYCLPAPFLLDRSCSGDVPEYLSVKQCLPCWFTRQATPLVHSNTILLSHSRSHLLHLDNNNSTATLWCGSWTHSSAWPIIATVNRRNPLAWVGVVWALTCLLIHACLSCLLLPRVESGLIHRGWIRGVWTCPTVCELSVWTRFGKGSGERPCRSTWWVVSLQPSSGTEFCVCDPWNRFYQERWQREKAQGNRGKKFKRLRLSFPQWSECLLAPLL